MTDTSRRPKAAADLDAQFAALGDAPAPPAPEEAAAPSRPRRPHRRTSVMPAEQEKPAVWDARINLTLSPDMKRALVMARASDGIEATARIRAMISLWQDDERLKAKVDKLAKDQMEKERLARNLR